MTTTIDLFFGDIVSADSTDTQVGSAVGNNKKVRLLKFGGFDRAVGDGIHSLITLEWGSSNSGWTMIRAIGGGSIEIDIKSEKVGGVNLIGDGEKTFRLKRINKSNMDKEMGAWIQAVIFE